MPPGRGNMAASSATVRAPKRVRRAPRIQRRTTAPTVPPSAAATEGTLKIPDPMVDPMRTAAALQTERRLGRVVAVGDRHNGVASFVYVVPGQVLQTVSAHIAIIARSVIASGDECSHHLVT